MTAYSDEIQTAHEMIAEAGGPITLTFDQPGTRNPVTQLESGRQTITVNTRGVVLPPGRSRDFERGSLVGRDVVEVWVAAKGITHRPTKGWRLIAGGKTRTIFWDLEYAPDGTPILWKFYAEA